MMELSGHVKQFTTFMNQLFPGGALFLLLSESEFKKLMMQLSSEMLEEEQGKKVAARVVGENTLDGRSYWVLSDSVQLSADGSQLQQGQSPFLGGDAGMQSVHSIG